LVGMCSALVSVCVHRGRERDTGRPIINDRTVQAFVELSTNQDPCDIHLDQSEISQ
jgi:hypothetical protein